MKNGYFVEKSFHTGEVLLNYAQGPNNGPPLVLLPGQSAAWTNYQPVLKKLSKTFQVYAVSIRGHGKSEWTPGEYSFDIIACDISVFLEQVVARTDVYLAGHSSGALIALLVAAKRPDLVKCVILEDPPLFSAEWPRIKQEHVFNVLTIAVEIIDTINHSRSITDLSAALKKVERPVRGRNRPRRLPDWLTKQMAKQIIKKTAQPQAHGLRGRFLPRKPSLLIRALTQYDADFSRAWLDGRIYRGLDHEEALRQLQCPALLFHANWFIHEKYGLVGAMNDDDAKRAISLIQNCSYRRVDSGHSIHSEKPDTFVREVLAFAGTHGDLRRNKS